MEELLENYRQVTENIVVRKDIVSQVSQVDTLIFDVDGVLIDVSGSFPVVISEAVKFYFKEILKWPGEADLITPEETRLYKFAGGFNQDWDIVFATALLYLFKGFWYQTKDLRRLRDLGPSLVEFTKQIEERGGGLGAAEEVILAGLDAETRKRILDSWDKEVLQHIFFEIYAGEDLCYKIYQIEPKYFKGKGLIHSEEVVIDKTKIPRRISKLGLLTGRTNGETEAALELTGLRDLIPRQNIITDDDGLHKPDPEALRELARRLGSKCGIYVGDTLDDLWTVQFYQERAEINSPKMFSCIVLSGYRGEEFRDVFMEKGADIIAGDVNVLMEWLDNVEKW